MGTDRRARVSVRRRRAGHDGGYHLLFSHPRLLADLLAGFIDEPWVHEVDLGSLERVNAKLEAGTLLRCDGDMVWRARLRAGGHAYLYVVLEFQSQPDRWMAVRMAAAVLLLYLHLIRERLKTGGKGGGWLGSGLLPPVYPLVLFNGDRAWTAARDVADLVAEVPGLGPWSWRPSIRYHVLVEQSVPRSRLDAENNLVAVLFALEQCRTVEDVIAQSERLAALLQEQDYASLRQAFRTWIQSVLAVARGLPIETGDIEHLSEFKSMLSNFWQYVREEKEAAVQKAVREAVRETTRQTAARTLVRLLERRFGPLTEARREQILRADPAMVEVWLDRITDQPDLESVLATPTMN